MCLIGMSWQPGKELLVAANRDEFHARATAPAGFWPRAPDVFGGRDLLQGGSWLAVSAGGRFAAVTNVRRMVPPNPQAPSRGELVARFVAGRDSALAFAEDLAARADDYAGFNLLLYDGTELRYCDNHPEYEHAPVTPGVHVVSNDQLDTPWPKALRLKAAMQHSREPEALLQALADPLPAPEGELPDTGVGREMERMLSPPFIITPTYGTRASTFVRIAPDAIQFIERRFGPGGEATGETRKNIRRQTR